jgi:CHAT domain-containing protein
MQSLDFAASRAAATSPELINYRYIHFASHGFLNSANPELSGILLSMVDQQGRSQNGFIQAHEIYNLKLAAEVVVLSACQTGLGKEIKGEGLVGLTRGFMYAGAARVMASLWKVDDEATADLMVQLYNGILKQGLRPAAALRAAQVAMWKEKQWAAPYYWAAFILQGEWKWKDPVGEEGHLTGLHASGHSLDQPLQLRVSEHAAPFLQEADISFF